MRKVLGTEWLPGCIHDASPVPCTVLDIFSGSARAGLSATALGRDFIGIDVNPAYVRMAGDALRARGVTVMEDYRG